MKRPPQFDPVTLEIYRALYTSVAEEMGIALKRTAHSPNIKERRDYSCAVFDARGRVIAQGDHMPVHLGSMPMAVDAALREIVLGPGDVVALNDPYAGGTHLPDITLISGVFAAEPATKQRPRGAARTPLFYVANRAHHADIGGATPGSMGLAADIYGEGLRIPPTMIVRDGRLVEDVMRLLLANVRGAIERRADFEAQIGSLSVGANRLQEIVARNGVREAGEYAQHLIAYSARVMETVIAEMPDGIYRAEDVLDSDGVSSAPVRIRVSITVRGKRALIDFTGSAPQVAGPVNAVQAITVSAVTYVFRCLLGAEDVPASAGLMFPLEVVAPRGTIVNAEAPAPVAGGNVETSQRIVDVLFKALSKALPERVPAASQGTMNNLTIGGADAKGREFAYYETIAGGMGARPHADGLSGVHTHMTNSLNTPIEALEYAYPLRVLTYQLRSNSGGTGRYRGGDGIVREIQLLVPARVSLLADRREHAPYGLAGGEAGEVGRNFLIKHNRRERIAAKGTWTLGAGDRIVIETPGGGGHGHAPRKKK